MGQTVSNYEHVIDNRQSPAKAIVLAAGKGKRLQSEQDDAPKVLRQVAGKPMLQWVVGHLPFLDPSDVILVVGFQADRVRQVMGDAYAYAMQHEQLGTGHAVASAAPLLQGFTGDILVIYGDMPLFYDRTYAGLLHKHQTSGADCTLLTAVTDLTPDYGRIVRDSQGRFAAIVEMKDCTPEQLAIREVNPGVYAFKAERLFEALSRLKNNNAQGEYYLTDVPKLILMSGGVVETETIHDGEQVLGVNTSEDLQRCERIILSRPARQA